jgi:hypothetical protein
MLCAIVGARSAPRRPQPQEDNRPRPVPRAAPSTPAAEYREPAWVRRYDQARRENADRARKLCTEHPAVATVERLPKTGWREDQAGGRAVRPYLVAHEQRQRTSRGDLLAPHTSREVTASLSRMKVEGARQTGEWDELTVLVRQWHALQQPVA